MKQRNTKVEMKENNMSQNNKIYKEEIKQMETLIQHNTDCALSGVIAVVCVYSMGEWQKTPSATIVQ